MTDNAYLDTINRLEPEIAAIDLPAGAASIAISLKRIADALNAAPRMGCVCPPGANKDCENPICPRRNIMGRMT